MNSTPLSYDDLRRFLLLVSSLALAALLISLLGPVLMLFVVVFFVAMVLNPVVSWLEKRRVKRGLGVMFVMVALIGGMIGAGFLVVPPLVEQVNGLAKKFPTYQANIEKQLKGISEKYPSLQGVFVSLTTPTPENGGAKEREDAPRETGRDEKSDEKKAAPGTLNLDKLAPQFGKWASEADLGSKLLAYTFSAVGGLFTFVIALLLVAFILANPRPLVAGFLAATPERHREAMGRTVARTSSQMVAWMRATIINGVITGVSTGVILHFLGVQPALVFGLLSCLGELVPNLGPIVASVPAVFVAAGMGTTTFLWTALAYLFVQQVESNILVPFIMGKEMELHPVTIVFFALAMGSLFGITGAILAVPAAAVCKIVFDEFYVKPQRVPVGEIEAKAEQVILEREWPASEVESGKSKVESEGV